MKSPWDAAIHNLLILQKAWIASLPATLRSRLRLIAMTNWAESAFH